MSLRSFWSWSGVVVVLAVAGLGCSHPQEPAAPPTTSAGAADNSQRSEPVAAAAPASPASPDSDPFHITKPTASLDGVPPAPSSPSPESIAARKVCPNCGTANDHDAAVCKKCGAKLN